MIVHLKTNNMKNIHKIGKELFITSDEEIISLSEINSLPLSDGEDIQTNMSNI